jgi:2-iminobutanoate/2-iminopropanoate deaminase
MRRYDPPTVPAPVGSYTQAMEVDGGRRLLFISGQIPEDASGVVPPDFESQCRLVWRNIVGLLESAGLTTSNLVKVTTYLTERGDADANSRIRRELLGAHRPALTVIVAQTLESQWLLEIDAIAASDTT